MVTWADSPEGPWSKPVDLKVGGIDPEHVVDEKGNRYLLLSAGDLHPLSADGLYPLQVSLKSSIKVGRYLKNGI